jgi:hypothetical protein
MEFQRTKCYDLVYMKRKELGWKENLGIQTSELAMKTLKGI